MNKHSIVKTALGAGLMAASLAASATQLHSFTQPSIYYKVDGAKVYYTAFIPSAPYAGTAGGAVVMLELYNSGTISSWNYAVGPDGSAGGGVAWSVGAATTITGAVTTGMGYPLDTATASQTIGTLGPFYFGQTGSVQLSFIQTPTISSQACNVTFSAILNSDDYLVFSNFSIQPSGWPAATDSVSYRTKTGTAASDTASYASADWNASNFSATKAFSTFGAFSVPIAGDAGKTYAASSLTKANLCTNAYTAKNALNSSGTTIGGKAGMMRLW